MQQFQDARFFIFNHESIFGLEHYLYRVFSFMMYRSTTKVSCALAAIEIFWYTTLLFLAGSIATTR